MVVPADEYDDVIHHEQPSKIYNAETTKDNLEANQFIQYDKFVQKNLQKYQPK